MVDDKTVFSVLKVTCNTLQAFGYKSTFSDSSKIKVQSDLADTAIADIMLNFVKKLQITAKSKLSEIGFFNELTMIEVDLDIFFILLLLIPFGINLIRSFTNCARYCGS